MYVVTMKRTTRYEQGTYAFSVKKECQNFIDSLTDVEADAVTSVEKFLKSGAIKNVWYEFFVVFDF